jgi:hypothetical protein
MKCLEASRSLRERAPRKVISRWQIWVPAIGVTWRRIQ